MLLGDVTEAHVSVSREDVAFGAQLPVRRKLEAGACRARRVRRAQPGHGGLRYWGRDGVCSHQRACPSRTARSTSLLSDRSALTHPTRESGTVEDGLIERK